MSDSNNFFYACILLKNNDETPISCESVTDFDKNRRIIESCQVSVQYKCHDNIRYIWYYCCCYYSCDSLLQGRVVFTIIPNRYLLLLESKKYILKTFVHFTEEITSPFHNFIPFHSLYHPFSHSVLPSQFRCMCPCCVDRSSVVSLLFLFDFEIKMWFLGERMWSYTRYSVYAYPTHSYSIGPLLMLLLLIYNFSFGLFYCCCFYCVYHCVCVHVRLFSWWTGFRHSFSHQSD